MKKYDLSHSQKRIWYLENVHPDTPMFNIGGIVNFKTKIDVELLKKSIINLILSNEGLRLQFHQDNSELKQYVSSNISKIEFIDFSESSRSEEEVLKYANVG